MFIYLIRAAKFTKQKLVTGETEIAIIKSEDFNTLLQ